MNCKKNRKTVLLIISILSLIITALFPAYGSASSKSALSKGQSVYVPIYSHIYHGARNNPFLLTAILSIRNTDLKQKITIISVDYFDSDGNLLKKYVDQPTPLKKLASMRHIIQSKDKSGGSGAKFIVRWESAEPVNPPLIESIMISTQSQQGISFVSRGQVIEE